uniref:Ion_trans_2 domain-containing protein n=2 Tax=Wuchereria bancrofti TaxID=6293 RepID=A0AAF5Q1G9_WUCBA
MSNFLCFSRQKLAQFTKMALPHCGLYFFIFLYLMAGAWTFATVEDNADREQQLVKLSKIRDVYQKIAEIASQECSIASKESHFRHQLFRTLSNRLSSFMEARDFLLNPDVNQLEELVLPKWTAVPSILYALSILTTTGYLSAVPMTKFGQFIAIVYGLVGIPLMVLAAVDIGRFLSDIVLRLYRKYCVMKHKIAKACGCSEKKQLIMELMETKGIPHVSKIRKRKRKGKEMMVTIKEGNAEVNRLPLSVNASILLVFCMLGGVCYTAAGGQKSFLEAFFVTFNLVANLTMAEMPNDLNNILTFFYILIFVTFGLAVLSMCGNLAASELRAVFMKIHYFGRKISWRRQQMSKEKQSGIELTEMLKIIIAIRELHPEKDNITSEDIMGILSEVRYNPLCFDFCNQKKRRDTIAFTPQSFEALRFADELDVDDTVHRALSRNHLFS